MKRLSLLLVVIFMVTMSWATIDEFYSFSATTGTYTPITGTAVTDILSDDAISAAIPIGFTFNYGDNSYTEVKLSSNGWIGLGAAQTGSNLSNALNSTTVVPVVAPLWDDMSMASGTVQYLLSGTAPNRIFTIQYADLSWNYGGDNQFNFQVRLYESGKIDIIYGSATGTPNNASASIGINMLPGGPGWFYSVTPGAPATASTTVANTTIVEFPAQGTIYEFVPVVAQANDLSVQALTGSTTPTQGILTPYMITVRNRGTATQSVYQVKLLNGTVEIGSIAGTTIAPNQNVDFTINWTPSVAGPATLYGKVVLAGDQNATNDQSNPLAVSVQPAGVQAVTIGAGDQTARVPMDFYWKNSLFECIYTSDELGFVTGTITSLAFYNNFVTSNPNGATKIWLGSTPLSDLSGGWIPSTQMTLVFDGNVVYPAGANTITIPLSTPYMHTPGNLVMMVNRPMDTQYYSSSDYFLTQTIGSNRALNVQSDSTTFDPAAPPAGPTVSGIFPKTTIFYTGQAITNDMGCQSVTGNVTPSVGSVSNYVVTVKNNGTATQTNYSVKLMKEGNVEIASVPGTAINSLQTLSFTIPWTPSATGPTYVYGKVVLAGDEIAQNNESNHLNVVVQAAGVVAVTVGNGGSTGRMPLDMFYKNSLFETMYLASELNIGGLLTGIQFYNSFATNLPNMPTNIWVGETTQTDLSAGWIPSTQLTQVFTGTVNYPSGSNNVLVQLTTPYAYGGGNLVVMVERPMDTQYYSSSDVFVTQTGTLTGRTRNANSDSVDFDPAAPPAATAQGMFPKTTFMFITENMGALNGTVTVGGAPLEGATVSIVGTPAVQITNAAGQYSFPYVFEGAQQVNATKHGYTSVTNNVTIIEDQTVTSNFTLALLPQVTVSGMVVGSDQPTVGLVGATINLTGYEPYSATTTAGGLFSIPNVFASQTYDYTVTYAGYTPTNGQAVVGTTNLNMGTIIVNEIALPATQVVATEAANFSNVVVTWSEPGTAGGEWLSYCGDNDDSIGTGGVADFDVAIRFPAAALTDYAGMSLYSVKVWPAQAGTFSLRVWTGGNASAPGAMVVDQAFTPVLDQYNEITLATPVPIQAGQELWFGYRCNVTSGYPAGCDAGPQDEGLGNMMYFQGAWTTLAALAPTLTYNWNIEGYVGYSAPTRGAALVPLAFNAERFNTGTLGLSGIKNSNNISKPENNDRVRTGYKVWRLLAADQANEANWTLLTPSTITPLTYTDNAWQPLPSGVYKYAVKAAYTNGVLAPAAFSNEIHKGMMGTLTGTVTDVGTGAPIADAIITAGDYSGTSNATGVYSFGVYQGIYTVTCAKPGFQPASQPAVTITGLQTTTQNFALAEIALAPTQVVSEQVQNNTVVNLSWMPPDPNAANVSEDFEGTAFPPEDWTQIITDTSAAGTTGVYPTWCSVGTVALTPEVAPHGGAAQAAVWWSYNHQDEWLITPQFSCPPASSLDFWAYVFLGSTNDDHYWVKVSTDNGSTWTPLWDATAQTGGWNYYATPISIDLASYAGQQIKLAFHADDPPSNDGLWYVWFIDDITVGNAATTLSFAADQLTTISASTGNRIVEGNSNIPAVASRAALSKGARAVVEPVLESSYSYNPPRALVGYKAWRLLQGQETNEAVWTSLTPNTITATGLPDTGWAGVPDGTYKWAVKAVYTGNVMSVAAFSNPQTKLTQVGTIAGLVRNPSNVGIAGATVVCGTVSATTNASGAYSMTVGAGTVNVTASANGYTAVTQTGIVVVTGQTTTVNFTLPVSEVVLSDGFETYPDFTLTFAPWTLVDVDMSTTYGMTGITWENAYAAMAYMVFNPTATVPPVTDFAAQEGNKMAASFASTTPPNNDWLITPQFAGGGEIRFYARSYVDTYGLERFKVGVSTTGTNPNNFTIISGTNYIQAPVEWTEYIYNLSGYAGQQIYVGIQCLSNDAFIFGVDNVRANGGAGDDPTAPALSTQLYGNYPNPFNPETTIRYSVKDSSPVTIGVYNLKGQLVKTLVNDTKAAGEYNVVWNGTDNSGRAVSSGVYYYKMYAGKFSSTRKMILMK